MASGSVVTHDVPAGVIVTGVPAREVRQLSRIIKTYHYGSPCHGGNMRESLLRFYRRSVIGRALLSFPRWLYLSLIKRCLSDKAWCRVMYKWSHGHALDLDNPRTLNEKIQWLKLYNRQPEYTNLADKYKVRDYIRDILGEQYLIPLLAVAEDPRQIDFGSLQEPFIIKSTHSSGQTLIVRDKTAIDWQAVVTQCRQWLRTNLYREGREWQYNRIPPKIIVERLLVDEDGHIPFDYKFHCFHGKIGAIQVDIDRQTNHRRNFYDTEWSKMPFTWSVCAGDKPLWPHGRDVEKPVVLPELISVTERLAQRFPYIRIDWYVVADRIYFGEMTFHHGGGYERILPVEWDKILGDKIQLPMHRSGESVSAKSRTEAP